MYSNTALMCFCGAIQAGIYAFIRERDSSAWKLGWNIRLFTPAYSVRPSVFSSSLSSSWLVDIESVHHVLHPYPWAYCMF